MRKLFAKFVHTNASGPAEVLIYDLGKDKEGRDRQEAVTICKKCAAQIPLAEAGPKLSYVESQFGHLCLKPRLRLSKVRKYCSAECQKASNKRARLKQKELAPPRIVENAEVFA
jgi:hypothetical protein